MKKIYKILTSLMLLMAATAPTLHAQTLYAKHGVHNSLEPGTRADIELCLDNPAGTPYYGFQAEVTLPAGVTIPKTDAGNLDIALNNVDATYRIVSNVKDGKIYLAVFSSSNTPPPLEAGTVMTMQVDVADSYKGGDVTLKGIKLVGAGDKDVKLADNSTNMKVAPISISLDHDALNLNKRDVETLTATFNPDYTTDKTLTWTSSDESVATVTADGKVTAIKDGITTITATTWNGKTATCEVLVNKISMELTNNDLLMRVGFTSELMAIVHPDNLPDKRVTWSTDNEEIITVDENGIVTALAEGTATVTATSVFDPEVTAVCNVTVVSESAIIPVSSIAVIPTELELTTGDSYALEATVKPDIANDKTVTWRTSDRSIATVSEYGVVTAVSEGTAVIYASSSNGLTAECAVTVVPKPIDVASLSLTNTELLMRVGYTSELLAIVRPDDATDKRVTWKSANETIASVDENGIVTAKAVGTVIVTVTSVYDPSVTAECKVTVVDENAIVAVAGLTITPTQLEITEGETYTLTATITPDIASDKTVTWRSSDRSIATVADDGTVTGVGVGTAIIYASSSNGLTAECVVTVIPAEVEVLSISLTNTELLMRVGYTSELAAIVRPDNATDKRVTWSSADESIATVDENGIVTAHKIGTVIITVTSVYDPSVTATCKVIVVDEADITAVTEIKLSHMIIDLMVGDTFDLIATISPDDATDKTVTWRSDDRSIATVSDNGVVTGVGVGNTVVYASSSNGLTVECIVYVSAPEVPVTGISVTNTELLMRVGHTADILAIIRPDNATDKRVIWRTDNAAVATVDNNGVITANAVGFATIIATSAYNQAIRVECKVTVVNDGDIIPVTGITLNRYELDLMAGNTFDLIATVTPANATDKSVTWKSSDRSVATVDENGKVTAVGTGTTIIYASTSNGLTAECVVTVGSSDPSSGRLLTPKQLLRKGNGTTCTFIVMMDISDSELSMRAYRFAVGYTDPQGESRLIAETPLRYCHTTPEIFNNPDYDFWAYTYVEVGNGKIINSNLRHLDGREEECPDASIFRSNINRAIEDDEWIMATPTRLYIKAQPAGEMRVAIYAMTGVPVYNGSLRGETSGNYEIDLDRFAAGTYVVSANCGGIMKSKRIIVR